MSSHLFLINIKQSTNPLSPLLINDNIGINLVLPLNLVLSNICDFQTYKCGSCFFEGYGTYMYIVFIMSLFTSMCIKRTDCSSTFYQLGLWYVGNKCINDWWIYLDISCLWQNSDTLCDLPVRKRLVFYTSNRFAKRVRFKSHRLSSMSVNSS